MGSYGRVLAMSGKVEEAKEQLKNAVEIAEKKSQEQLVEQVFFSRHAPFTYIKAGFHCISVK